MFFFDLPWMARINGRTDGQCIRKLLAFGVVKDDFCRIENKLVTIRSSGSSVQIYLTLEKIIEYWCGESSQEAKDIMLTWMKFRHLITFSTDGEAFM